MFVSFNAFLRPIKINVHTLYSDAVMQQTKTDLLLLIAA